MKTKNSLYKIFATTIVVALFIFSVANLSSCSSSTENKEKTNADSTASGSNLMAEAETMKDDGKGFGSVKNVEIGASIDDKMAAAGQKLFEAKCTSCHKWQKEKYVGPGLMGVTQRRKPEWIMNQILDPLQMTAHDPTAKELLATYLTQMTNQNVSEPDARNILEYFRKMDGQSK